MRRNNAFFLAAVFIMLGAFAMIHLWDSGRKEVPPKKDLALLPLKLGEWQGTENFISQRVIEVSGVDDYIMRTYVPSESGNGALPPINLYIGYYRTQRTGRTYHSPKNCLPGSGWELMGIEQVPVNISGQTYMINKVLIQKGLERQLVLYWYQDRGRIIASEYWTKFYLVYDSIKRRRTDGALVRIICPVGSDKDSAFIYEKKFLDVVFPYLKDYLPD